LKSTVLAEAEAKGSRRHMFASLGFRLRQYSQFLTITVLLKTLFWEEISNNKGEWHQFPIVSFPKISIVKNLGCSLADHDVAKRPYRVNYTIMTVILKT